MTIKDGSLIQLNNKKERLESAGITHRYIDIIILL